MENTDSIDTLPSSQQNDSSKHIKIHIVEGGATTHTIVFSGINHSEDQIHNVRSVIHTDDSIRAIKKKLLIELFFGKWSSTIKAKPAYEEIYFYGYIQERAAFVRMFQELMKSLGQNTLSKEQTQTLFQTLGLSVELSLEEYSYDDLQTIVLNQEQILSIKIPIGMSFLNTRDYTFEVDPFRLLGSAFAEPDNMFLFENKLLLNFGELIGNEIYACFTEKVFDAVSLNNAPEKEEYLIRYYYPLLYKAGVRSRADWESMRGKMVADTRAMLDEKLMNLYKSVELFHKINATTETIDYTKNGICRAFIQVKNEKSSNVSLEMIFKSVHCSSTIPFIKYNPGSRRENLYRLYYEKIARNGKKIPYLSKTAIWRLSKETGKKQQVSLFIETAELKYYLHIEINGNILIELDIGNKTMTEAELDTALVNAVNPMINMLNIQILQTSVVLPKFISLRDVGTQIIDMQYCLKTHISRQVSLEKIPCIYSIFTFNKEYVKNKEISVVRYRRVENFQEMDAETALILEMLQQAGYAETSFTDIVDTLVARFQMKEDDAKMLLANYYTRYLQVGGEVIEKPGFVVSIDTIAEDSSLEIKVAGITSVKYIESLFVYFNSIVNMSQHAKKHTAIMNKMSVLCGTGAKKTAIGNADGAVADNVVATNELVAAAILAANVENEMGFVRGKKEADELFRQFGIFEDDEEEDSDKIPVIHPLKTEESLFEEEDMVDISVDDLLKELRENVEEQEIVDKEKPIFYDDEEEEAASSKESDADAEKEADAEAETESKETSMFDSMLSIFKKKPEADKEAGKESDKESGKESEKEAEKESTEEAEEDADKESEKESTEESDKEPKKPDNTAPPAAKSGPIFYEDEDEEESEKSKEKSYGGAPTEDSSPDDEKPIGLALQPNPFLKRLQRADPALFLAKPVGKFGNYSTSCQPVSRHPVVLSKEEFESVDPASYEEHIKYGTDEAHQNYYICPKYWCFLTDKAIKMTDKLPPGRPMSEKDVLAGKCGRIIDKKDNIPPGAYALKLSDAQQYPGFKLDSHPDGHCLPCCAKQWDSEKQVKSRQKCLTQQKDAPQKGKKLAKKTQQYVISSDTYPISPMRWGFLPIPVQFFLHIQYDAAIDKNIAGVVLPDHPLLLRWGVEHAQNQSILGLFADIYAYKQNIATPSVKVFKQLLAEKITLDLFAKIHNGTLTSIFRPAVPPPDIVNTYTKQIRASKFAGKLSAETPGERILLENVVSAYDNFLNYIRDENVKIDHTYIWDLICEPGVIIPGLKGMNLIVMEMDENDMTGRIELVCPTSAHSRNQFEEGRENILVLKHEEFYEPVYLCTFKTGGTPLFQTVKTFTTENIHPALVDVLRNIEASTKKYCPALPSLPKVYKFRSPISLKKLLNLAETLRCTVEYQIVNYSEKIIGLGIRLPGQKTDAFYVPCSATATSADYPVKYMDDLALLGDYDKVKAGLIELHKLSSGEIPCHPVFKVLEGDLLVGFITETNQFVPIVSTENIHMDNLKIHPSVSHIKADMVLQTTREGEKERIISMKKIRLETQFYGVFRNTIRKLLAEFANRGVKVELQTIMDNRALLEKQKREKIEEKLREVVGPAIIFVDIDDAVLMELEEVNECYSENQNEYCLVKENGVAQLSIPAKHLLAEEYSNEKIYYGRLSDELMRNERVRLFMLNTRNYTNVGNIEYSIKGDEFIIAQSVLTTDYFQNMDTFESNKYATNSVFDTAQPSISVLYPDEPISYAEQYGTKVAAVKESECVVEEKEVIGNNRNFWKRTFPTNTREIVYGETEKCNWMVLMELWKHKHGGDTAAISIEKLREMLKTAYKELVAMNPSYSGKLASILKMQGKSKMMEPVVKNKMELEEVLGEEYYLSDLDIWVFCWKYKLPVVVFNTNGLKGFSQKGLQWLKMGGGPNDAYVFVRSNIGSFANKIYGYHLIRPSFKLNELPEFERMVQEGGLSGSEYRPNVENLVAFFDKLTIIKIGK